MKFHFLKNRLGHRLTTLMLVVTLLPLILFIAPTLDFITDKLQAQLQIRLQQASAQLGLAIEERLDFIASAITSIASDPDLKGYQAPLAHPLLLDPRLNRWFEALMIMRDPQPPIPLLGSSISSTLLQLHPKPQASPNLWVEPKALGIYFYQLLDIQNPALGYLVAKINASLLWQLEEATPPGAYSCVLTQTLQPLACTTAIKPQAFQSLAATVAKRTTGYATTPIEDTTHILTFWRAFDPQARLIPDWIMVVGAPATLALYPLDHWTIILSLGLIIFILFMLILAVKQIRRLLSPLEQLQQGARSMMRQFEPQTTAPFPQDELTELAQSFNWLQTRLSKQHDTIEAMANIDQMILSTLALRPLLTALLKHMKQTIACDTIYILVLESQYPAQGTLYGEHSDPLAPLVEQITTISAADRKLFSKDCPYLFLDATQKKPDFLKPLPILLKELLCLPIYLQDTLHSIILLGYYHQACYRSADLKQAREMSDRVAVALTNAAWEKKLYHQAHYDYLTDLPNRLLFHERLDSALKRSKRDRSQLALLLIDLDNFKRLNDTLGHGAGDAYLKEMAKRFQSCLRSIDTVARLGGDEFVIILSDLKPTEHRLAHIAVVADKILKRMSEPWLIEGQSMILTGSIGIACYPDDGHRYEMLLKAADTALYTAKQQGKGLYRFYSHDVDKKAKIFMQCEHHLNQALKQNQFFLMYQPRMALSNDQVVGAEALIRWQSPTGIMTPDQFIPMAEHNGLIQALGAWIIKNACLSFQAWHQQGLNHLMLAINLSTQQFRDRNLLHHIQTALQETQFSPQHLELEITESMLMADVEHAIFVLKQLRQMGVRIAIDDFGTGYSSLSYLKQFPIDRLKIDRSFIHHIDKDKNNAAIVSAMITLAKHLELGVVAEGVETNEELHYLRKLGCEEIQGFIYSKPLSESELSQFLLQAQHPLNQEASHLGTIKPIE